MLKRANPVLFSNSQFCSQSSLTFMFCSNDCANVNFRPVSEITLIHRSCSLRPSHFMHHCCIDQSGGIKKFHLTWISVYFRILSFLLENKHWYSVHHVTLNINICQWNNNFNQWRAETFHFRVVWYICTSLGTKLCILQKWHGKHNLYWILQNIALMR